LTDRSNHPEERGAEQRVIDGVRRILQALRLSANAVQTSIGVTPAQLYVLRHLTEADGASLTELARRTFTDRSSVSDVVERLVQQGLAERSASGVDRRRASVRITSEGMQIVRRARPAPTDLIVEALKQLSVEELEQVAGAIDRLVAAMGLEDTPPTMMFEEQKARRSGHR
jgi:DNA-binding MarR family transcriptional regulator